MLILAAVLGVRSPSSFTRRSNSSAWLAPLVEKGVEVKLSQAPPLALALPLYLLGAYFRAPLALGDSISPVFPSILSSTSSCSAFCCRISDNGVSGRVLALWLPLTHISCRPYYQSIVFWSYLLSFLEAEDWILLGLEFRGKNGVFLNNGVLYLHLLREISKNGPHLTLRREPSFRWKKA